ncbi:MAG: riboflavin biosynthesis protein RibF [Gallionellales bacterium 35-53-114]|jgi:riboflavin kinase/FMN adenylyltransferase|nr:MAG: riboflavin biosynthesis protein RibF [Gallionellales bacterium 35-53-114]OYZ65354.1 MAG: riboflavin biosynthesis protein RibF [Gallionellales bacterium 24-53-125]OZB08261.1 MAG: riboflavin biosynthesis protein RibF [Gallionellales bacterium 39-52-133]HQS58193.1 bifunctional riboflavin kinase/FAD synthetase [Gallionellaceae bacterium]HQS73748.1 bifunctional riboflavin kinase/FAD synthetase [Gallionellaceae bacterium]
MLIFRALQSPDRQPVALTVGNFDGVHLGHKALLSRLLDAARLRGIPSAVVIFEPHPREFFTPDQAPARLTSLREKLELLAEVGVDRVHICRFNSQFAQMSASSFIDALHKNLSVKYVLIGDDFRFGSGRSGDFALMEKIANQQGFTVEAMHSVMFDGVRASSTAVRAALAGGHMRAAMRFLGRPYSISGRVVHGDKLGREIGFPTANVQMKHNRPPLSGIFVVRVTGDHIPPLHGAASLGVRPTVHANGRAVLEIHLLDFAAEIYGQHLRVEFLHKLRNEEKYPDLKSLTQQIALDVANTRNWFNENGLLKENGLPGKNGLQAHTQSA